MTAAGYIFVVGLICVMLAACVIAAAILLTLGEERLARWLRLPWDDR